jgi:membrane-bound ClpP family serine protease
MSIVKLVLGLIIFLIGLVMSIISCIPNSNFNEWYWFVIGICSLIVGFFLMKKVVNY